MGEDERSTSTKGEGVMANQHYKSGSALERFWNRVNKDGPVCYEHLGQCWEWVGPRLENGYGKFGQQGLTHRYSWVIHNDSIPDGLQVLHKCDNRCCVNPDHLFVGTPNDNMQDKIAKGNQVRGEDQGSHKLTEDEVKEIRRRYKRYSHTNGSGALAKEFNVSLTQIWRVAKSKHWRHVE